MGKREHQLCGATEMGSCYKSRTDVEEKRKGKNEKIKEALTHVLRCLGLWLSLFLFNRSWGNPRQSSLPSGQMTSRTEEAVILLRYSSDGSGGHEAEILKHFLLLCLFMGGETAFFSHSNSQRRQKKQTASLLLTSIPQACWVHKHLSSSPMSRVAKGIIKEK